MVDLRAALAQNLKRIEHHLKIKVLKVQEFVWQYQVVMYRHWAFAERNWNIYEESIIVIIFFIVK